MIGITTYRDYFSAGTVTKQKSVKTESLLQYCNELSELFGGAELVPSRTVFAPNILNKYSGVVLFDHPTSLLTNSTLTGFTTANLRHHSEQLRHLVEFNGPVFAISSKYHLFPKWLSIYARRIERNTDPPDINWPDPALVSKVLTASVDRTAEYNNLRKKPSVIFGDSHAIMMWKPGWTCHNKFGRTLYRALQEGLGSEIDHKIERSIFCYGNIDLRYHLAQRPDPVEATKELAREYVRQASKTSKDVQICSLLPNCEDKTSIMKAYLYNGQQSYGSLSLRNELRNIFREECLIASRGTNVVVMDPPKTLYAEDGGLRKDFCEARGVHVSPIAYEYCLSSGSAEKRSEFAWKPA